MGLFGKLFGGEQKCPEIQKQQDGPQNGEDVDKIVKAYAKSLENMPERVIVIDESELLNTKKHIKTALLNALIWSKNSGDVSNYMGAYVMLAYWQKDVGEFSFIDPIVRYKNMIPKKDDPRRDEKLQRYAKYILMDSKNIAKWREVVSEEMKVLQENLNRFTQSIKNS